MKTYKTTFLTFLIILTFNGCQDGGLLDSIPGTYRVDVEVVNRKWVYLKSTQKVEGYMEYFHNQLISTISDSMCCHQPSYVPPCLWQYSFENFNIIKQNGTYYIRNNIEKTDGNGNTYLTNINLSDYDDKLTYEGQQLYDYQTSPGIGAIRIIFLSLSRIDRNSLKGEWFVSDSRQCDGTHLGQEFYNGEYAKIKLTKVE